MGFPSEMKQGVNALNYLYGESKTYGQLVLQNLNMQECQNYGLVSVRSLSWSRRAVGSVDLETDWKVVRHKIQDNQFGFNDFACTRTMLMDIYQFKSSTTHYNLCAFFILLQRLETIEIFGSTDLDDYYMFGLLPWAWPKSIKNVTLYLPTSYQDRHLITVARFLKDIENRCDLQTLTIDTPRIK